ncbi:MAG: 3-oxoacyl-ACP synthase III [Mariprofundaceae bacterium]|nr:3-oxoacyl-ACP synthase III [Mariprofundaceae bacterium]
MRYQKVWMDAIGYQLGELEVSSAVLEKRLAPSYKKLHFPQGQLEALTGVQHRRWWPKGHRLSDGAVAAARHALAKTDVPISALGAVVYTAVAREQFEPATACRVAGLLGVEPSTLVFDISNACLGMLNGMLDVANRIELGQIKAGLVVACESSRDIINEAIAAILADSSMKNMVMWLATLTGGSGAVAVVLTDGSFSHEDKPRLHGASWQAAPQFHDLCSWGLEEDQPRRFREVMRTDSIPLMKNGVALGQKTWAVFLKEQGWSAENVDKVICHQVGSSNQKAVLGALQISLEKDFVTFPSLGNMGPVSVPLTAAIAAEKDFLKTGDHVAWLGIGSGLNCMMLAFEW